MGPAFLPSEQKGLGIENKCLMVERYSTATKAPTCQSGFSFFRCHSIMITKLNKLRPSNCLPCTSRSHHWPKTTPPLPNILDQSGRVSTVSFSAVLFLQRSPTVLSGGWSSPNKETTVLRRIRCGPRSLAIALLRP